MQRSPAEAGSLNLPPHILAVAHFWPEAIASSHGIYITTTNGNVLQQYLYAVRRELGHPPDYANITVRIAPDNANEVWMVKKEVGA